MKFCVIEITSILISLYRNWSGSSVRLCTITAYPHLIRYSMDVSAGSTHSPNASSRLGGRLNFRMLNTTIIS